VDRAPLDAGRLRAALGPRWASVSVVQQTSSTNADLLAAAAAGAADRTLLAAEVQLAGRGRFDRVWSSPRGAGLTVSFLLRPAAPTATWGWLPLLAGVALAATLRDAVGVPAVLKWPNDVLGPGGKLAGILVQAGSGAAVVGVGLNVSTTAEELPVGTASSLVLAGAADVDRTELLAAYATALDRWARRWDEAGGDAGRCGLADAYSGLCDTLGRQVRVTLGGGAALEGRAEAVAAGGALMLRTAAGVRTVSAGDVEHLRPA